ncbi:condensation domain-containing protein, partial [Streptomyces tsukubensis]|uniref:condensation domain-containing protein n=1 Tax=Streptomyces tsukubensis TaxID=83656 RepID=UPI00369B0B12
YTHQDLPFEQLVHHLAPQRDLSRNPLFHILFEWEENETEYATFGDLSAKPEEIPWHTSKLDLTMSLSLDPHGHVTGVVTYATALFQHATIARLTQHYLHLLDQVAHAPDTPLDQLVPPAPPRGGTASPAAAEREPDDQGVPLG